MVQTKPRERGATLLMVTFISSFLLIPLIGICIDSAMIYWMKARLSSAVDASALATGRALNVGQTGQAQLTYAMNIGQMYFKANFPSMVIHRNGYDETISPTATISIDESVAHVRTVSVTASMKFPTFFMPMVGYPTQLIGATGQATRRDANVMLVLDRSNSMNNSSGSCGVLVASAQNFVNQFVDGRDQLGLVTFQTGANVDYPPTLYFKSSNPSLNTTLSTLVCGGDTSTAQGLYFGYQQIKAINQPGSLNVILLFTDGQPNTLIGDFPIKTASDNRYGVYSQASQIVSTPKSSCATTQPLTGAIADGSVETATSISDLNATGDTYAIFDSPSTPITTATGINSISAAGCSFDNNPYLFRNGRQDISSIPTQDHYGNSTVGLIPLDYFPTGYQYAGLIRPDMPRTVRWAAFNAADSQAYKIRNDSTYTPIIYTIGLAGNETMAIYQDFMERMANDPRATNYDSTKPQGQFILASNTAQLSQAFQQVASQILRLSK